MTASVITDATEEVICWNEGSIAHIRFNRAGRLNAIGTRMASQFRGACENIATDQDVRVVVISGNGNAFMAGGDVAEMREEPGVAVRLIDDMHHGLALLSRLNAPVISSVQGAVAGAGMGVALSCDFCIAASNARFSMAYPLIGASADCGTTWALARLVGQRQALEIALLSEPIDAERALDLGIVNRVVRTEALQSETQALALRLAEGPTIAYGNLKALIREAPDRSFENHLRQEADRFVQCTQTNDFREGAVAFLEKRRPVFIGS